MSEKKVYTSEKKPVSSKKTAGSGLKDNKNLQIGIIVGMAALIIVVAVIALLGKGDNPVESLAYDGSYSGSYEESLPEEFEAEYIEKMSEYSDVIIPEMKIDDDDYIEDTVFVGDSNTEALSNFYYVSIQYVLGYTGMGIQSVTSSRCMWFVGYDEPVTIPTAVGMLKPRRVIINFGTNNAGGMDADEFVSTYKKAINAIESAYPYCDIIVESIFPVGKVRSYPNIRQSDIDEMNLALVEMCREEGYKFLNTAEYLMDDDGFIKTEYISSDGIHLSKAGYMAVLEYVQSHKYITKDTRPSRGYIPTRRTAPETVSSSESRSSSVVSSSSYISSSSSYISSSSEMSSSLGESSSAEIFSSSNADVNESSSLSEETTQPDITPETESSSEQTQQDTNTNGDVNSQSE